jgi:hypothetical protein
MAREPIPFLSPTAPSYKDFVGTDDGKLRLLCSVFMNVQRNVPPLDLRAALCYRHYTTTYYFSHHGILFIYVYPSHLHD